MPLLSPRYLSRDELYAQAEYHGIEIPRREEVLKISKMHRQGGAKLDLSSSGVPVSVEGGIGSEVELQSAYVLEPSEKAAFTRVIEELESMEVGKKFGRRKRVEAVRALSPSGFDADTLYQDQLVRISGSLSLSSISAAGKVLHVAQQLFASENIDVEEILDGDNYGVADPGRGSAVAPIDAHEAPLRQRVAMPPSVEAEARRLMQSIYLRNEVPAIPVLLELATDTDAPRVFVNCSAGGFVGQGAAQADSVEGEYSVLATVSLVVSDDPNDGYASTEAWTLHGWETTMKAALRSELDALLEGLMPKLDPSWRSGDMSYFIKGPSVILDAIAIF